MRANEKNDVWKFVDVSGKNKCWLWIGGTFSGRYGRFFYSGKPHLSHRFIYELINGEIPNGLFVMHKCNNKMCCNPKHLTVGTNSENQRHASMSGSFKVGEHGIRGIGFDKRRGYWKANGYRNGKLFNLYTGPHREKAISARKKWEEENGITFDLNSKRS